MQAENPEMGAVRASEQDDLQGAVTPSDQQSPPRAERHPVRNNLDLLHHNCLACLR
jgi:hypothetical protein